MYLAALPEDARLSQPAGQQQVWTTEMELLATLVEVSSVAATAKHRFKKPVEINRPTPVKTRAPDPERRRAEALAAGALTLDQAQKVLAAEGRVRPALPAPPASPPLTEAR